MLTGNKALNFALDSYSQGSITIWKYKKVKTAFPIKKEKWKSAEVFSSELISNKYIILGLSRKVAIYPCSYTEFW